MLSDVSSAHPLFWLETSSVEEKRQMLEALYEKVDLEIQGA